MTFVLANLSCRRWPSRAVSSPGRASASDAAAGAAGPLARRRTRSGERPRRRNLRRVPPQSTGLSFPLSVLTKRLPPGIIFYRDSFGGVMSDLRSPRSFGRPAGALVVRTYAGDRKVEIYDMFHTPGTYMPPTGLFAMTHGVSAPLQVAIRVLFLCLVDWIPFCDSMKTISSFLRVHRHGAI